MNAANSTPVRSTLRRQRHESLERPQPRPRRLLPGQAATSVALLMAGKNSVHSQKSAAQIPYRLPHVLSARDVGQLLMRRGGQLHKTLDQAPPQQPRSRIVHLPIVAPWGVPERCRVCRRFVLACTLGFMASHAALDLDHAASEMSLRLPPWGRARPSGWGRHLGQRRS